MNPIFKGILSIKNHVTLHTHAFAVFSIIAATIFVFFPLFYPTPKLIVTPDFSRSDSWHLGLATKFLYKQKIDANMFPLWTNKINGGYPLLGDGQTGLFFVPNIIFFKFFDFTTAFNLSLVFSYIMLGTGMYFWLRSMKLRFIPSWFGSLTLTFSGITFARLTHLAVLQAISFLPWIMLVTYVLSNKPTLKYSVLFALIASQQLLSGFTQASVITILFSFFYFLWRVGLSKKKIGYYVIYVIAILLTVGLSAIHILPAQEFIKESVAAKGMSLEDTVRYSFPLKHLLTFIDPFFLGNPRLGTYPDLYKFDESIFWENSGFVGFLPFIGIFLLVYYHKLLNRERRSIAIFFIVALAISFFLMLGKFSPTYLIYYLWPLNQFRVPARFLWVFVICLVNLGVIGFKLLIDRYPRKNLIKVTIIILTILNTSFLIFKWNNYHLVESSAEWLKKPESYNYVSTQDRIMTLFSEENYNSHFNTGWTDAQPYYFLRNAIAPNSNLFWDLSSQGLVAGRFLRRSAYVYYLLDRSFKLDNDQITVSISSLGENILNLYSIKSIVSTKALSSKNLKLAHVLRDTSDQIYIYTNVSALSPVRLTQSLVEVDALEVAKVKLEDPNINFGKKALVEQNFPALNSNSNGIVTVLKETDEKISMSVTANKGQSLLIISGTYYPGWKAYIDGNITTIYPANINQKAVLVPEGKHLVNFFYDPDSLKTGTYISIGFYVLCGILLGIHFINTRRTIFRR